MTAVLETCRCLRFQSQSLKICRAQVNTADRNSDEPLIDFDEEAEPDLMDDEDDQMGGGGEDPDNADHDDNVVVSGDANAAAAAREAAKNTVTSEKDKKVPNDKRTTTPYMTKYEKARVLGTRALQIRYAQYTERIQRSKTNAFAAATLRF